MTSAATVPPDPDNLRSLDAGRGWLPCQQIDPETFFPPVNQPQTFEMVKTAKWLCGGCPIRVQCLELALSTNQEHGVWGGRTVKERKEIRRVRRMWGQDTTAVAS